MSTTTQNIAGWGRVILVVAACILLAFFIRREPQPLGERPPEIAVKSDTVTIRDTIYIPAPQLADSKSLGFMQVTLPVWRPHALPQDATQSIDEEQTSETNDEIETEPPDSVPVAIQIEQKHYKGDDYDAWVSGWNPSLDSLHICRPTRQITTTKEITRWKTRRWGLSVGVGAVASPKGGIQPGVFVGASYTFFAF